MTDYDYFVKVVCNMFEYGSILNYGSLWIHKEVAEFFLQYHYIIVFHKNIMILSHRLFYRVLILYNFTL